MPRPNDDREHPGWGLWGYRLMDCYPSVLWRAGTGGILETALSRPTWGPRTRAWRNDIWALLPLVLDWQMPLGDNARRRTPGGVRCPTPLRRHQFPAGMVSGNLANTRTGAVMHFFFRSSKAWSTSGVNSSSSLFSLLASPSSRSFRGLAILAYPLMIRWKNPVIPVNHRFLV